MSYQANASQSLELLPSPNELVAKLPATDSQHAFVRHSRQAVVDILNGRCSRLLMVVGPCSIHDITAAKDFAKKLQHLSEHVSGSIQLVMRTYFEKPRTSVGWKGMLYDPGLDGSNDVLNGLTQSRQLLVDLAEMRVATATEFLDTSSPRYLGDLISWGSVGSRTSESQAHRQMISALSIPTGFKNGTDGNLEIAVNALHVAGVPHAFIGLNDDGRICVVRSKGNPDCHIVLRGGSGRPNYDKASVLHAQQLLRDHGFPARLMVDCSHDNSGKNHDKQADVFRDVMEQILSGNHNIVGMILESHLKAGSQILSPSARALADQSVTDPCLDWETTEQLILWANDALKTRAHS
ncbi:MAG: 3-deoxy-7-phosphoheptulonate synthase [Chlamydiales bacterium]|nr:3-deoxy-7-phosphoheptulonate synthase [Chlamydiales bacterium]